MSDESEFQTILETRLKGNRMSISFPVPEELIPFSNSIELTNQSIEYYLLARYAFIHKMDYSFLINSFWAVEYSILPALSLKYKDLEELKNSDLSFHQITKYWDTAKIIAGGKKSSAMNQFDSYVGKVYGYYKHRYPNGFEKTKLVHTGKQPPVFAGDEDVNKKVTFQNVVPIGLEELDHFINFMLHDISLHKENVSSNLMTILHRSKNTDLYQQDNKYSIIHPNKAYHGELASR